MLGVQGFIFFGHVVVGVFLCWLCHSPTICMNEGVLYACRMYIQNESLLPFCSYFVRSSIAETMEEALCRVEKELRVSSGMLSVYTTHTRT